MPRKEHHDATVCHWTSATGGREKHEGQRGTEKHGHGGHTRGSSLAAARHGEVSAKPWIHHLVEFRPFSEIGASPIRTVLVH